MIEKKYERVDEKNEKTMKTRKHQAKSVFERNSTYVLNGLKSVLSELYP